jgi:hypothetical protein
VCWWKKKRWKIAMYRIGNKHTDKILYSKAVWIQWVLKALLHSATPNLSFFAAHEHAVAASKVPKSKDPSCVCIQSFLSFD